jgi:protein involved in polysaccharide export with SLBB domain
MFKRPILLALIALPAGLLAQEAVAPVTLMSGDLLRIDIWREPDLGGEFLVDPDGMVTLPLLGQREVTDVPIAVLRDSLVAQYRVHLRNPSISITPLRRVYVLGEVNRPGLLSLDPTVSLAGVIALAGGANANGDLRRITVIRSGETVRENVTATRMLAQLDVRSGDQILVGRRSWFDRNSTFLVSAVLSVTSIVITLLK